MKKTLIAVALSFAAVSLSAAELVEAIVARVGDRIITRSQYLNRFNDAVEDMERNVPPEARAERMARLKSGLLDDMIGELLVKDRADRLRITVSEAELQDAVRRLKAQYGIESDEAFDKSLQESGLTRAEMEGRLRDTLITNKVFGRELRARQDLSDKELRARYDREKENYRLPERARVREIIILIPEMLGASELESLRERAAVIAAAAARGEDFAKLVEAHSEAPSKEKGGDIGIVVRGEMLPQLDAAVFNADARAAVGPIESRAGLHILKVDERLPSEVPGFDAVKERLRKEADDETFQRDYRAYMERLRKEAFVQIVQENVPAT